MNWKQILFGTLIGYMIAVPVAACIALLFIAAMDLSTDMRAAQITRSLSNITEYMIPATVITAMTAWPGYLMTLAIAHWRKIGSPRFFAICGVSTAVLAVVIADTPRAYSAWNITGLWNTFEQGWFVLPGGLAGGLAYAYWHKWIFTAPE